MAIDVANPGANRAALQSAISDLLQTYRLEAPTTGQTITLTADDRVLVLNPAGALAALTIQLAAGADRRQVTIITRQSLTALTILGNGADSVDWLVGDSLPQYGAVSLLFISSITSWVVR